LACAADWSRPPDRNATNAMLWSGFAAIALMMVARDLWGWRSLF
jgi:hypothetical protein